MRHYSAIEHHQLVMSRLDAIQAKMDIQMGWHTLGFVGMMSAIALSLYLLACFLLKRNPKPAAILTILLLGVLAAVGVCIRYF